MKKALLIAPALLIAGAVNADTQSLNIHVEGDIADRCEMTLVSNDHNLDLTLASAGVEQQIAEVGVWCNFGGNTSFTYSSANGGKLKNPDSKKSDAEVKYTFKHYNNSGSDIDLSTPQTREISSVARYTLEGKQKVSPLYIITDSSVEYQSSGNYSDTITMSFAAN